MRDASEQLQLRLRQTAERAAKVYRPCSGRFMAAEEKPYAVQAAKKSGVAVSFDGGWEDAERTQVCFHPEEEAPVFTAVWMEIRWQARFATLDHRALLGSLMALGMERAFMGDLVVSEGRAYLYVLPELAVRLPMEWTKAGNTTIAVARCDEPPRITPPKGMLLKDTVASLRLDNVLSSGMKTSRGKAAELIRQGLVAVDHQTEERVDRMLNSGQLLSVRGFGRIRLCTVDAPTRKDRLPITLEIFSKT